MANFNLKTVFTVDMDALTKAFDNAEKKMKNFESKVQDATNKFSKYSTGVNIAAGAMVGATLLGTKAFIDQQKILVTQEVLLKNTGRGAMMASAELKNLAEQIDKNTFFSGEAVIQSQNLFITLDNISSSSIPSLIQASSDLAQVYGVDLVQASQALGMAMNDPEEGLGRLEKLMKDKFDPAQKALIKNLIEENKLFDAQKLILNEVTKNTDGAAKAAYEQYGALDRIQKSVDDLGKALGEYFLPILTTFSKMVEGMINFFIEWKGVIIPVVTALTTFALIVVNVAAAVKMATIAVTLFNAALALLTLNPIALGIIAVVAGVAGLTVALSSNTKEIDKNKDATKENQTVWAEAWMEKKFMQLEEIERQKKAEQAAKEKRDAELAEWARLYGNLSELDIKFLTDKKTRDQDYALFKLRLERQIFNSIGGIMKEADARDARQKIVKAKQDAQYYKEFGALEEKKQRDQHKDLMRSTRFEEQHYDEVRDLREGNRKFEERRQVQDLAKQRRLLDRRSRLDANMTEEQKDFIINAEEQELQKKQDLENQKLAFEMNIGDTRLNYTKDLLGNLSSLQNSKTREFFEIGKAASIASATINTYEAITKTMSSVPYPFNIPLAIAQGIAGFAQVQSIASTEFAMAEGGIVTGPTRALIGEAGDNEAVIPLNDQGSSFMADSLKKMDRKESSARNVPQVVTHNTITIKADTFTNGKAVSRHVERTLDKRKKRDERRLKLVRR